MGLWGRAMRQGFSSLLVLAMCAVLAACVSPRGASTIGPSGYAYNEAIAQTKSEQLLLNLVRLKYRDAIVFMDVDGVTTQHQYGAALAGEALFPFRQATNGSLLLIPGMSVSERPTVVYKPLDGSQFAQDLLAPISPETILLLANSGWSIERLLACCVERLGDLSNGPRASGPTPETIPNNAAFRDASKLLRALQKEERVRVHHLATRDGSSGETVFEIDATGRPECPRLKTLLKAGSCVMRYRLVAKGGDPDDEALFAQTRTVLGALYALSHTIDSPEGHNRDNLVTRSVSEDAATPDWARFMSNLFRVNSDQERPETAAVSVHYRDHWYWIADNDLESKTTFNLILFLLALQSAESDGVSPLLTLSAGG